MKILIAGASGLIGSALRQTFVRNDYSVSSLTRGPPREGGVFHWDPVGGVGPPAEALDGAEVVINLAGANLSAHRWSARFKKEIRESRIASTALLSAAIGKAASRPRVFINASAVGFYGHRGDSELDESGAPGSGFLAGVCKEWEEAAKPAEDVGVRTILARIGPVLSRNGGVLATMIPAFKLGTGGWLGHGDQWLPWIALPDAVRAVRFLIDRDEAKGPFNLVSPNPVTNRTFARALGKVMHRPAVMSVPRFAAHLVFGDVVDEVGLASTRALPAKLLDCGYVFEYTDVNEALKKALET